jgi:hypothetical protein
MFGGGELQMSSSSVTLSAGLQQVYNSGLLPSGLNTSILKSSSASQLNQLASTAVSLQQIGVLLGYGSSSSDSATLSSAANNSLALEGDLQSTTSATGTDPLTVAVNNALTSSLNAAADKFLPQNNSAGSSINLLG